MGNTQAMKKINFEDLQVILKHPGTYLLINTLDQSQQDCLILNTTPAHQEEEIINQYLTNRNKNIKIAIYGKNCNDEKVYEKYQQLIKLGFYNLYLYTGGLFEWLMLQDIFGYDDFPTTKKEMDFIKYKSKSSAVLNTRMLEYL